ncbi:DNA polymerase III subunit gamma and tau [Actinoplanes sp. GCM10030250]|uniref:DNA polymerase III subunit gamma and tau n=1 Tax=Actinoplanes sp. GCM10030250 TaxID=3273376 RepID=UPI003621E25A
MALALYRKYRPRTFAEVIGQEHVTEPLSQALRSGRLNHAYLFSGPRGCGKTSSARILARSLNCEQGPTPDPCGVCGSCKSLATDGGGSIDVIEIDAASHGGVDDARELREKAFFAPASSRYKIYVIDEAHMVSSAGFNALLKLVEEPPDYVKFIFATTEPDKVLGTIRSRTHHYPFRLIPPAVLRPYLQMLTETEGVHVDPAVFPLVVRAGGGSARDSLSVLDQLIAGAGPDGVSYPRAVALLGVTDVALIDEMCDALATGNGAAAYATIDRVAEAGHDPRRFASDLLERLRDLIILQQVPDAVAKGLIDGPADQLETMSAQATHLGPATLSRSADIVHNGLVEMRGTTAPRLLLELITARMLLPGAEDSTGALLQRLERLERGVTLPSDAGVRVEHTPPSPDSDVSRGAPAAPLAGSGTPASPAVGNGGPGGGVGLAAARAAAAAGAGAVGSKARPAVVAGRQAPGAPAVAPVSAAPVSPAPVSAAPVSAAPVSPAPVSADPVSVDAASGGAAAEPDWNQVAGGALPQPAAAAVETEDAGFYDDEPPWDEEPPEPVESARPAVDERLEKVRAAWQSLGAQQKRVRAMQDFGIGIRELDGDTVVFAAPTPALVERFLNWRDPIAAEFGRAVGGQWQIRCEVGDTTSPTPPRAPQSTSASSRQPAASRPSASTPSRPAPPSSGAPSRSAPPAAPPTASSAPAASSAPEHNTGRTESRPSRPQRPAAADADDDWPAPARPAPDRRDAPPSAPASSDSDWPEPARPGGPAPAQASSVDDWPEPARPGGGAAPSGSAVPPAAPDRPHPQALSASVPATAPAPPAPGAAPASATAQPGPVTAPSGSATAQPGPVTAPSGSATAQPGPVTVPPAPVTAPPAPVAAPPAPVAAPPAPVAAPAVAPAAPARSAAMEAARAAARPGNPIPSSGLAAARAAAAGGRNAAPARASDSGGSAPGRAAAAPGGGAGGSAGGSAWSDGSPTEEAPYDPEYDGVPPPGGTPGIEGFDPGDEPLDDVIDEKTARQSSEEQAMQLLRTAFGAEKIGEM